MSLLSSKPKRKLGVDLAANAVKILELSKTKHTHCVENYAVHWFSQAMITGGTIHDPDAIVAAIQQLFKQIKTSIKTAVLAVPDACTLRKIISVSPQLTPEDLEELATIEVGKLWPHATEPLNFDFQWCQPNHTEAALRDLLIVASRSDYVEQRRQIAKRTKLRICAMDVESQALCRVLNFVSQKNAQPMGWVHFAEMSFDVYIFDKDIPIFTHRETFKTASDGNQDHFVYGVLNQVKSVLQVFQVSYPMYEALYQVILSETSIGYRWASVFSEYLSLQVIKINPFNTLSFAKHVDRDAVMQHADDLLIACGLALRA